MATVTATPARERSTAPAVRTCYDLLEVMRAAGMTDFTDGKYVDGRNDPAAYLAAQARQADYLLNQACCGPGTRLLDIGCGYGRIVEQALKRGAKATGITISPPQVANCRARGLDVHEVNYRDIFSKPSWEHAFDAIVANGSLEHFAQAADAAAERTDEIYKEMFGICRQLLVDGGRFVTTAIHFSEIEQFDAAEIRLGPEVHSVRNPAYQYAMLVKVFGGWYPEPGQLRRCAAGCFELIEEEDGTHDYYLTSEYWLQRFKRSLACDPRVWWAVTQQLLERPAAAWKMLRLQLIDESWAWQFRPPAPMRLFRQTWLAK